MDKVKKVYVDSRYRTPPPPPDDPEPVLILFIWFCKSAKYAPQALLTRTMPIHEVSSVREVGCGRCGVAVCYLY